MSKSKKTPFSLSRRGSLAALLGTGLLGFIGSAQAKDAASSEEAPAKRPAKNHHKDIFKNVSF